MKANAVHDYFHNIRRTVWTILVGLRVTLKYCFAKTVTVQYPDVAPVVAPRFRGLHFYEIEKCIACDQCAKACPVDCIYIEKSGPRKVDKAAGTVVGGAMLRYAVDYGKCLFCGLCCEPCPTQCLHLGNVHDMAAYDRESMIVEFTELAKQGLQTPQPLWMRRDALPRAFPGWAQQRREEWLEFRHSDDNLTGQSELRRAAMLKTLEPSAAPKKPKKDDDG